ncbi:hypothetical protein ADK97_21305 [Streptomyces sp. H021]|nr:hypothetical protein ADK97_21305 [Streptomyces sp. H021]
MPAGCLGGQRHAEGDEAPLRGFAQAAQVQAERAGADGAGRLVGQVGPVEVAEDDTVPVLGDAQVVRAGVEDGGEVGPGVPDPFEGRGRGGDQVVPDPEAPDGRLPCHQQGHLGPRSVDGRQFRDADARDDGGPAQVVVEVLGCHAQQVRVAGRGYAEQACGIGVQAGEGGGRRPLVRMRDHRG